MTRAGLRASFVSASIAIAVLLDQQPERTRAAEIVRTRVTTFVPAVPAGSARAGSCWTRSIAVPGRPDAWRCMVGNEIYDPCFTLAGRPGIAVCDANPAAGRRGFALRLLKPLPSEPVYRGEGAPWLVEIGGGAVCMRLTGTHAALGSQSIGYDCTQARGTSAGSYTGLIDGSFSGGTVWHARKAIYRVGAAGAVSGSVAVVPLIAVWR